MLNNDEILQLNTLMYLNDTSDENPLLTRVDNYFNHHKNDDLTVGDWINSIDTNKLIDDFDYGSGMTGRDWKNIIGSVKKDDTLMNLTIAEPHVDTESGGVFFSLIKTIMKRCLYFVEQKVRGNGRIILLPEM